MLAVLRVHRGELAEVAAVRASAGVDDEDGALGSLLEQPVHGQVVAGRAGARRRRAAERGRDGDRRRDPATNRAAPPAACSTSGVE